MKKIDPVCKSPVDTWETNRHSYFDGKLFYFCSDTCKHRFNRMPFEFIVDRKELLREAYVPVPAPASI